ncbi:hypothetical protein BKA93DRAFT_769171 [Sparassis latifolia]
MPSLGGCTVSAYFSLSSVILLSGGAHCSHLFNDFSLFMFPLCICYSCISHLHFLFLVSLLCLHLLQFICSHHPSFQLFSLLPCL